LAERRRKLARVENWETEDLPLRSGPFAAELPLRPGTNSSQPPPEVFEANVGLSDLPPAPPLPGSVTAALGARSSPPDAEPSPTPKTKKTNKTKPESAALEPAKKASRWWLWVLLLAGIAAYFVLRPS